MKVLLAEYYIPSNNFSFYYENETLDHDEDNRIKWEIMGKFFKLSYRKSWGGFCIESDLEDHNLSYSDLIHHLKQHSTLIKTDGETIWYFKEIK